jgi:predicted O-methyltransferase YrrM
MNVHFNPSGRAVALPDTAPELAQSFGSGMMDSSELLHLAGTLASYPWDKGGIVVEIGAYEGDTTVFMARLLTLLGRRVPIVSIDPFERAPAETGNPQGHYAVYLDRIVREGVGDTCMPLVAFSQDAAAVVPEKIAVLIVDGAHHYEQVAQDLALYAPKVLPGGLIFIDDYGPLYPGVVRATDEFFSTDADFMVLHQTYFVIAQRGA